MLPNMSLPGFAGRSARGLLLLIFLVTLAPQAGAQLLLSDPDSDVTTRFVAIAGSTVDLEKESAATGNLHSNGLVVLKRDVEVTGDVSAVGTIRNLGAVSGTIYEDDDADGVEEPGEAGLVSVTVELVDGGPDLLRMAVYERGVGPTLACGTGAAAAAVVAAAWGLVDEDVAVAMPGGTAHFTLSSSVTMQVPVVAVAEIEYPWHG